MDLPLVDGKGKEIGRMQLIDEAEEILKKYGISVIFEYNPTKNPDAVTMYIGTGE